MPSYFLVFAAVILGGIGFWVMYDRACCQNEAVYDVDTIYINYYGRTDGNGNEHWQFKYRTKEFGWEWEGAGDIYGSHLDTFGNFGRARQAGRLRVYLENEGRAEPLKVVETVFKEGKAAELLHDFDMALMLKENN